MSPCLSLVRSVRTVAKSVSLSCPSVCPSICVNISVRLRLDRFPCNSVLGIFLRMCRDSHTWLKLSKITGHVIWRPNYDLLLPTPWNRHTGALFGRNGIRLLARPSFRPPTGRISLKFYVENFVKICREGPNLVHIGQKKGTLYMSIRAKIFSGY